MEFINFQCGKCKEYWNIYFDSEINNKRCQKCKKRICEKCYDDTEFCLKCEIEYLEYKVFDLNQSIDYYNLELRKLYDLHNSTCPIVYHRCCIFKQEKVDD